MAELNSRTAEQARASAYDVTGRSTIAGLFTTREQASNAVNGLKKAGFTDQQIGIVARDKDQAGDLIEHNDNIDHSGAAAGAVGGTLLGGLVGLLLGTGAMIIPGVGPVIAGGIFAETLGIAALGAGIGAASGSLLGSLSDSGMSEDESRYFESGFRTGQILVTVKATQRLDEALDIIVKNGGEVGNYYHSQAYRSNPSMYKDVQKTNRMTDDNVHAQNHVNTQHTNTQQAKDTIQLKEEQLNVSKHNERVGEVVINKKVVEDQKRVEVPVMREEVVIERHKVNQVVPNGTHIDQKSQEIRIPVMEEQVNVNKQTVVTEEINVGKKQVHGTEVVNETVRKEEAYIQNKGNVNSRDDLRK